MNKNLKLVGLHLFVGLFQTYCFAYITVLMLYLKYHNLAITYTAIVKNNIHNTEVITVYTTETKCP